MTGRVTLFPRLFGGGWGCDFELKIIDLTTIVGDFSFALQCDDLDIKVAGTSIFSIKASSYGKLTGAGEGKGGPSMQVANKMDILTTVAAIAGSNPLGMMKTAKRVAEAVTAAISTNDPAVSDVDKALAIAFGDNSFLAQFDASVMILGIKLDVSFFMGPPQNSQGGYKLMAAADFELPGVGTAQVLLDMALPSATSPMYLTFEGSVDPTGIAKFQTDIIKMIEDQVDVLIEIFVPEGPLRDLAKDGNQAFFDLIEKTFVIKKFALKYDFEASDAGE